MERLGGAHELQLLGGETPGGTMGDEGTRPIHKRWLVIGVRDAAIIVLAMAAMIVSVQQIHPIFANQPTVVARLTAAAPIAKALLGPTPADTGAIAAIVSSPQFATVRDAFAADLVRTGRMSPARADSIAYYAVREADLRGIPPAVVFGVMLTENALFLSTALSKVGAVGLMQVYPKIWLKALESKLGTDLTVDSTNVKYGVYILSHYIKSTQGAVKPGDLNTGLLHYNGCVKGTVTPHCSRYPGTVRQYVDKEATALCGDKSFYACIAKPFLNGLFGKTSG